jgi:phosphopantetheinyl transferase
LHMEEMPAFWKLAKAPERQWQWLLGRIAAKDAIRQWLARETGEEMLHPAAFTIENDQRGQPLVKKTSGLQTIPNLSIAHCADRAVAIAHRDAVGIDIERIAERDARFLETIATRRERERLANFLGTEPNGWMTRLWCAKEAVGKLWGTGVDAAPQAFEAIDVDGSGEITILHRQSGRNVLVNTREDDGFIVAYTWETLADLDAQPRPQPVR